MRDPVNELKENEIEVRGKEFRGIWRYPLFQFELMCGPEKERVIVRLTVGSVLMPTIAALIFLARNDLGTILQITKWVQF